MTLDDESTSRLISELETRWEDPYVDFKRLLSLRTPDDKAELLKDILGLVNTQGRSRRFLLIGWDDKTRSVLPNVGLRLNQDRMQQLLNRYCDPPPHLSSFTHRWKGSVVGVVEVIREPVRLPYSVSRPIGKRKVGEVFVRHGTITEPPTPRELQTLADEGLNARLRESADELIRPDRRSLAFTPLGLSPGRLLSPKSAAQFQDHTVDFQLSDSVPDETRKLFSRLQSVHRLGIWDYDMYTVSDEYSLQVLEHAFAMRLIKYYEHRIPLIDRGNRARQIDAPSIRALADAMFGRSVQIQSRAYPKRAIPFTLTLKGLFAWARHEHLLRGQRSRRFDTLLPRMLTALRPPDYAMHMPVDSSRSVRQVGEFINQLWGTPTVDGEIFPAPLTRRELVLGWPDSRDQLIVFRPDQLTESVDQTDWSFVVVLAAEKPGSVDDFHSDFERTPYPTRLLKGVGRLSETIEWLATSGGTTDEVDVLDRYLIVNLRDSSAPRSPGQFAALNRRERLGRWLLVQADSPIDAFLHARNHRDRKPDHRLLGPCDSCWVNGKIAGTWKRVLDASARFELDIRPIPAVGIEAPLGVRWHR